jgi:hypothetical protein
MLNPKDASRSPLSSRIALPAALMLAGVFGLGISMIQPTVVTKPAPAPEVPAVPEAAGEPPVLALTEEQPQSAERPKAPEDLVSFCSKHVTDKRSFVIFKRGTCVVINEPCEDPLAEGIRILARCKDPNARFITEPTTDGDMIVTFKDPVFLRFTPKEMEEAQPWLEKSASTLLSPTEAATAGDGWLPPANARIGLLARRRLLEDAAQTVPVKVIRAKERAIASR